MLDPAQIIVLRTPGGLLEVGTRVKEQIKTPSKPVKVRFQMAAEN